MTIALLVVGFVNAWAVVYLGSRVGTAVLARWDRRIAVDERRVALEEATEARRSKSATPPVIPPDLHRRIMSWQDEAAQNDERAMLFSLYDELGDWDQVRAALPPAPRDDTPSTLLS